MISWVYLSALLVPTLCMGLLDRRFGLVLWRAPRRTLLVLALGIGYFLAWDLAAIAAGHYGMGQSPLMTGILLAPELPLEELGFVTFLCYFTLVLWGLIATLSRRTARAPTLHAAESTAASTAPARLAHPSFEEER